MADEVKRILIMWRIQGVISGSDDITWSIGTMPVAVQNDSGRVI